MGQRGPQPKPNIHELPAPKIRRPVPVVGMTSKARTVWHRVVKAYPREHFQPQHFDLLMAYCEASALRKHATQMALKDNYTDHNFKTGVTKESHWVGIMDKMAGRMQSLATKLGITKNATIVKRGGKGQQGSSTKPKSKRDGLLGGG